MPFHLAAFFENVDQALSPLAALTGDQALSPVGDDLFLMAGFEHLLGCYFGSDNAERGQIVATSLRQAGKGGIGVLPDVMPVQGTPEPVYPSPAMLRRFFDPLVLNADDRLQMWLENDAAGAAEDAFALVWLGDRARQADAKGWIPTRWTTTAAAMTANAWNNRTITPDQNMIDGTYEIGGMRASSTSCIAARLQLPGMSHRPGVLGVDNDEDSDEPLFRFGALGAWGRFKFPGSPPTVDFLVDAADNESQEIILDIRRVG